jgi:hypothetical protein
MVSALAVLSISFNSAAQESTGQSAFNRGAAYLAQTLTRSAAVPQRRTHLIDEVVMNPTIIQAPVGTTIVAGTTAINPGLIADAGPGATAAQLDVRCPFGVGRVVLHGNRVLNSGEIVAVGSDTTATQVVIQRCNGFNSGVVTDQNQFDNLGRIRANR